MACEHSYTAQAYVDARSVLETWSKFDLACALGDYNYEKFHGDSSYCGRKGSPHHKGKWSAYKLIELPHDVLVQSCMDAIMDVYTCSNDFSEMYIDFGGWHSVELPE